LLRNIPERAIDYSSTESDPLGLNRQRRNRPGFESSVRVTPTLPGMWQTEQPRVAILTTKAPKSGSDAGTR
jgi:hypothetical protein